MFRTMKEQGMSISEIARRTGVCRKTVRKYIAMEKPAITSVRRSLHSSNIIERMNMEIRQRIKVIESLSSESTAMKIIYLRVAELNEKWSNGRS